MLKLLVRMLKGEEEEEQDDTTETNVDSDSEAEAATEQAEAEGVSKSKSLGPPSSERQPKAVADAGRAESVLTLQELGVIFAPDRDGVLCIASALTYDDAPWISAALNQRSGSNSVRFISRGLLEDEAKMLGVKSLREQLFAGDEIVCPAVTALKRELGDDSLMDTVTDLLALSDALGAKGFHVVYDERMHPRESLMHPGLLEAQGPSIVVFMDGPTFSTEDIMRLIAPGTILPPLVDDKNASATSSPFKAPPTHSNEMKMYPHSGKGLLSCFTATDCLQIISGREFYIFDPHGQHLLSADDVGTEMGAKGKGKQSGAKAPSVKTMTEKAQRCYLIGDKGSRQSTGDRDIITRFPDQFSSFLSLPFGLAESLTRQGEFRGLLLRLPLRKSPSGLSTCAPSLDEIKNVLRTTKALYEGSLLLGFSHVVASTSHWAVDEAQIVKDIEVIDLVSLRGRRSLHCFAHHLFWRRCLCLLTQPHVWIDGT